MAAMAAGVRRRIHRGLLVEELEQRVAPAAVVWVDDDFDGTTPGWGVDHFDLIQDGIDNVDPGGTVEVQAGTYNETVAISKPVTLTGVDSPTIVGQGQFAVVIDDRADGTEMSGFTVTNPNNQCGIAIESGPAYGGTVLTGLYIHDNWVRSVATLSSPGPAAWALGIIAESSLPGGLDDIRVENNIIEDIGRSYATDGNAELTNSRGIQFWAGGGPITNISVNGNTIRNIDASRGEMAIVFDTWDTGTISDVEIRDNTIYNVKGHRYAKGIEIDHTQGGDITNLTVSGNTIEYVISTAYPTSGYASEGIHLQADDRAYSGVAIFDNTVQRCDIGFHFDGTDPTGVGVHCNNFMNNVYYGALCDGGDLDATHNWWGHATGPNHAAWNPQGQGDAVSDYVSALPWRLSPAWCGEVVTLIGQVRLYDTDTGEPIDVGADDILIKTKSDGCVCQVIIVGNPTGLGIVVDPIHDMAVKIVDKRDADAGPLNDISFIACSGAVCQISVNSAVSGCSIGALLVDLGIAADPDLDDDGNEDDLTGIFAGGAVKTIKGLGDMAGDVVVGGADAHGCAISKLNVRNGTISGDVVTLAGGVKCFSVKGGDVTGVVDVKGDLGKMSVLAAKDATGALFGGVLNGADVSVTGLLKVLTASEVTNSLIAATGLTNAVIKGSLTGTSIVAQWLGAVAVVGAIDGAPGDEIHALDAACIFRISDATQRVSVSALNPVFFGNVQAYVG